MSAPTPETPFASFAWLDYEASGGWNDLVGFYPTIEAAIEAAKIGDTKPEDEIYPNEDGHVVDLRTMKIVATWRKSGYRSWVQKLV